MTNKEMAEFIISKFNELAYGINARSIAWKIIFVDDQDSTTLEDINILYHLRAIYNEKDDILCIQLLDKYGSITVDLSYDCREIPDLYELVFKFKWLSKEDATKKWTLYKYNVNYSDVAYLDGIFLTTEDFIEKFKKAFEESDEPYISLGEVVGDNSSFDDDEDFFDELVKVTDDPARIQLFIDEFAKDLSFGFIPFEHIMNLFFESMEFETPKYIK